MNFGCVVTEMEKKNYCCKEFRGNSRPSFFQKKKDWREGKTSVNKKLMESWTILNTNRETKLGTFCISHEFWYFHWDGCM
jgi:hypothetical protein